MAKEMNVWPEAHVEVQTVSGAIPADELGMTLVHEHILTDIRQARWLAPDNDRPTPWRTALGPIEINSLAGLRYNPYAALQNCQLNEPDVAIAELSDASRVGVRTIVDPTCDGIGRFPRLLKIIAEHSSLQIIMGSGYYVQAAHPLTLRHLSAEAIAEQLITECRQGVGDDPIPAGIIGEIGVSETFPEPERRVLRGAAQAYCELRVPLYVHLPGWHRLGHDVLNLIEREGGSLQGVVLCHMNPSMHDGDYQQELAARGAWLGYDMIGMDFYYEPEGYQCPTDEENARAICRILGEASRNRLLISSDVFLKSMLRTYGGNGYDYVPGPFSDRLRRHGVPEGDIEKMLVENPRSLFTAAATW